MFIPPSLKNKVYTGISYRDNLRVKLIEYIQIHPVEGFSYEERELERAAEIALKIEDELNKFYSNRLSEYQSRARTLLFNMRD